MSYLVLARKWRPQKFEDVIGQAHVVHTLQNAVKKDRLAHAFLFTGARGVGKTTAARLLAKALQCDQGTTAEPCGTCQHCRDIAESRCVDVLEIDGASNRGIDQVRELRDGVRYMPQSGRFKLIIIDEVHMLTTEAFNALLKTLEEPPAHVKFIFATTEPHKIPVTILSRCQRFDFKRIGPTAIVEHLRRIVDAEEIEAEDEALHQIARAASGSMRDALSLLDQAIAYADDGITAEVASEALGIIDRRVVVAIVEAILARDASAGLDGVARAYKSGYDLRQLLSELIEELRHLVVVRAVAAPEPLIDLPEREIALVCERAQNTAPEDLQRLFAMALDHVDQVARADSPRLVLDVLVARMAAMPPYRSLEELSALIDQLSGGAPPAGAAPRCPSGGRPGPAPSSGGPRQAEPLPAARRESAPVSAPSSGPSPGPAPGPARTEARAEKSAAVEPVAHAPAPGVDARWQSVVDAVRAEHPALASFLEHGILAGQDAKSLTLRFTQAFYADAVRDSEKIKVVLAAARSRYEGIERIRVEVGSADGKDASLTIAAAEARQRQAQNATREAEALANPTVRLAMEIFSGTVVDVKPS